MLGHFQLGGAPLGGLRHERVSAAYGVFTLTGQDAVLSTPVTLTAEYGSYTLTGNDAGLTHSYPLAIEHGSFTVTGQAAALLGGFNVSLAAGSFTVTGQAATFTQNYVLTAEYADFEITGQNVELSVVRGPGGIKMVPRSSPSVNFSGNANQPIRARHGYLRATH